MKLRNIFISLIMLVVAVYGGVKLYMHFHTKTKIDEIMGFVRSTGVQVEYDRLATSIYGAVGIKGLKISLPRLNEEITIGEVVLQEYAREKTVIPTRLHILVEDFYFKTTLLEKLNKFKSNEFIQLELAQKREDNMYQVLQQLGYGEIYERSNDLLKLGYSEIHLNAEIDMTLNPVSQEAKIMFAYDVPNMGAFRIRSELTDFPVDRPPSILGFKIKQSRMDFIDKSFVNRLIKTYADERGIELEVMRAKVLQTIDEDVVAKEIKLSKESVQSIKSFIARPGKMSITIHPYQPVSVGSVSHYKPGDVPALLNLQFNSKH